MYSSISAATVREKRNIYRLFDFHLESRKTWNWYWRISFSLWSYSFGRLLHVRISIRRRWEFNRHFFEIGDVQFAKFNQWRNSAQLFNVFQIIWTNSFDFGWKKENLEKRIFTIFSLKEAMNSRLIKYFDNEARTVLIVNQMIKKAKIRLKYPTENSTIVEIEKQISKEIDESEGNPEEIRSINVIFSLILSKFDYLTYFSLIINFLGSGASLIWLPILGLIYFWAILSFPYPARRFWSLVTFSTLFIFFVQFVLLNRNLSLFFIWFFSKIQHRFSSFPIEKSFYSIFADRKNKPMDKPSASN